LFTKKLFFIIAILFTGLQIFGQNTKFNGTVLDSATQKSLYPATITLIDAKGQTVKTFNNNNDGSFEVTVNEGDIQFLVFNFVNYFEKRIQVSEDKSKLNLGNILLSAIPASLTEIIVKGKKPPVSFKVDRQVFKAAQFSNATSGNGVDVLKNLPSVTVNGQGEISFRGSNSFLVLVNGKASQGDPAFVLSQLSAASIENIEVFTSPSAAYDADGKSGIINIITKTGADNGWMIQSNGMLGTPPFNNFENKRNPQRYSADVSAAFRNNKWDISGGVNYLRNDIAGFREGDVFTIFNNIKTSLPSNGERSFYRYNYGGRIAALYTIDKKNTIGGGFYSGKKFQSRVADLFYNNSKTNQLFGVTTNFNYYNANEQQKSGIFSLGNLEYTHVFSKDAKIILAALYEKADLSGTTTNNNLKGFGSKDTIQYTVNPNTNPLNAYRLKSDFTQKLGAGNLQLGYQFRYDTQLGNFLYLTKNLGTNTFATDPLFTSTVAVYNRIHGVYIQYGATQKKLTYNGGIRLEHSNRDLY
jgi:hypothetical protein